MTKASVRVSKSQSDWLVIQQGVRQGDTPSSTMFLEVYINDLTQYLNRLGVGIKISGETLSGLLYIYNILKQGIHVCVLAKSTIQA